MASIRYRIQGYEQFESLFPSSLEWVRNDLRSAFVRIGDYAAQVLGEESRINPDRDNSRAHASERLADSFRAQTDLSSDGVVRLSVSSDALYEPVVREGSAPLSRFPNIRSASLGGISILDWVRLRGLSAGRGGPERAAYLVARAIAQGRTDSYRPGRIPNRYDLRQSDPIISYARQQIRNAARGFEIIGVSPKFSTRFRRQRVLRASDVVIGSRESQFVRIPRTFPADPIGTFRQRAGGRLIPRRG